MVLIDRAEDRLRQLCEELGENALPLVVDLLDGPQLSAIGAKIEELAGPLDVFHANAGAMSAARWRRAIPTPGTGC